MIHQKKASLYESNLHELSKCSVILNCWKGRAWLPSLSSQLLQFFLVSKKLCHVLLPHLDCHHHNPLDILLHGEQGLDVVRLGIAVDGHPQDQLQQPAQVTRIVFHHLKFTSYKVLSC